MIMTNSTVNHMQKYGLSSERINVIEIMVVFMELSFVAIMLRV